MHVFVIALYSGIVLHLDLQYNLEEITFHLHGVKTEFNILPLWYQTLLGLLVDTELNNRF